MSVQARNEGFKYLAIAGIAGACIGYFLASRKNLRKLVKQQNIVNNTQTHVIDLDNFHQNTQVKLVPLLNRIKEKLENYPQILTRNFVKSTNVKSSGTKIRVMQWNTLARALFTKNDPKINYAFTSDTPEDTYDWNKFRKWRILEEILRYDSDIICLEEMDSYEDIKPFLHSVGYTSVFCPKYESTCFKMDHNVGPDGCVLFYKMSKFHIYNLHLENVFDSETNTNQDQVFLIVNLKHKETGKVITCVCVHLKSKEKFSDKRANQIRYILSILKRHLNNIKSIDDHPILFCGDFNGEPFEEYYKLITGDDLLKFDNAYSKNVDSDGKLLPSTFKIREPIGLISRTIDFIFYTQKTLRLLQYLRLPNTNEIQALPNLSFPSDHLSLVCDFDLV